jgi:hypothetical protein
METEQGKPCSSKVAFIQTNVSHPLRAGFIRRGKYENVKLGFFCFLRCCSNERCKFLSETTPAKWCGKGGSNTVREERRREGRERESRERGKVKEREATDEFLGE